jgi:hypothetical protein
MKWKKEYKTGVWRTRIDTYYLTVQKRAGRKSHPIPRYYWRVSFTDIGWISNYTGLLYEMSLKEAMRSAKGAVLEAKILLT